MKQLFAIITFFFCAMVYGQAPTMDDVLNKKVKGDLISIQLENGAVLNIGDTLVIGMSTGNTCYKFVTQNFSCLITGAPAGGNISCIDGYWSMGPTAGGSIIIIKEIKAKMKTVIILGTHAQGFTYGTRILSISSAVESGEIKINGFMTSNEALAELKKWKDKLDLGLITQAEFDAKKAELSKYIK